MLLKGRLDFSLSIKMGLHNCYIRHKEFAAKYVRKDITGYVGQLMNIFTKKVTVRFLCHRVYLTTLC